MAKLILQILGESDIVVDSKPGNKILRDATVEDVRYLAQLNEEELLGELERVDFSLIQKLKAQQEENNEEIYFGIFLTDQSQWLKAPKILQSMSQSARMDIIASDGIWWKNILDAWCQEKGINWFPIQLEIDQNIPKGVADWEGMAQLLKTKLQNLIEFKEETILVSPKTGRSVEIDQIIVQHSSGTPATSGALYLWGIEQKLEGQNVDFVYMSRQNSEPYPHSGNQWQWRFKVPQIRQLLNIQDFAGAKELLSDYPDPDLGRTVGSLDRAVSFNLVNLEGVNFSPKGKVIERIAIALWSEKAFREKGQWMHWYLRVAGAFELAIRCLVEKQAPDQYRWDRSTNLHDQNNPPSVLMYRDNNNKDWEVRLSISFTVSKLLTLGKAEESRNNQTIQHQVKPVSKTNKWLDFKDFYCNDGWHLSNSFNTGFTKIRNQLYHSLQGDKVDQYLDEKTRTLGHSEHPDHPAKKAIQYLHYLIDLAGLTEEVQKRVQHYQTKVNNVKERL